MSFIYTNGIVYHCNYCKIQKKINFENSPLFLQIGDFEVINQKNLCREYNFDGNYIHRINCICENCLNNLFDKETLKKNAKLVNQRNDILNKFDNEQEKIEKKITHYYQSQLSKVVQNFNLCDFDKQIEIEMLHEKNLRDEKG